jgi:hypothetical protein
MINHNQDILSSIYSTSIFEKPLILSVARLYSTHFIVINF